MFAHLLKIFRAAPRSGRHDPNVTVTFTRTPAGVMMSPTEALKVSVVFACITVIAKAIASSPWDVFEQDDEGNRTPRRASRQWQVLNTRPNHEMTAYAWREALLLQALLFGNSYAEIERNARGEAMALWPLDADSVVLERARDGVGELQLRVHAGRMGEQAILPYRDVYHLHGPSLSGIEGLDVIAFASRTFGHAAAAEIFGSAFYGNNTQLGGVLSTEAALNPDQITGLRAQLEQRHGGPKNAHRFLVLQGGMKFDAMAPTPEAAQFVETRQFLVEEVCRWFGVPPHKVQHLARATYNNVEHLGLEFVRDALKPWATRLAQEADAKLMPFGNRLLRTEIQLDWLSYGDAQSKAAADSSLVGAGIITRNEARRQRGLNSMPDADELTVQQQYVPLGMTPAEMAAPAPSAPQSEEPADETL